MSFHACPTCLLNNLYLLPQAFKPEIKSPERRQRLVYKLQTETAPDIFNPRVVYDGNILLYAPRELRLPDEGKGNVRFYLRRALH